MSETDRSILRLQDQIHRFILLRIYVSLRDIDSWKIISLCTLKSFDDYLLYKRIILDSWLHHMLVGARIFKLKCDPYCWRQLFKNIFNGGQQTLSFDLIWLNLRRHPPGFHSWWHVSASKSPADLMSSWSLVTRWQNLNLVQLARGGRWGGVLHWGHVSQIHHILSHHNVTISCKLKHMMHSHTQTVNLIRWTGNWNLWL